MAQDGPTPPQQWYVQTPQGLEGPFDAAQLQEKVLRGLLAIDARVHDPEQNHWATVAEVLPDLNQQLDVNTGGFQPPPRPLDVRGAKVHSAGGSPPPSEDYLTQLAKASGQPARKPGARAPRTTALESPPEPQRPAPGRWEKTREILRKNIRNMTHLPQPGSDQGRLIFAAAAAAAFVAAGTYGLLHMKEDGTLRAPAQAAPGLAGATLAPPKPTAAAPPRSSVMPSSAGDAIGSGNNPTGRNLGSALSEPPPAAAPERQPSPEQQAPQPTAHYDPATFDQANTPVTPPVFGNDPGQPPQNPDGTPQQPAPPGDPYGYSAADVVPGDAPSTPEIPSDQQQQFPAAVDAPAQ